MTTPAQTTGASGKGEPNGTVSWDAILPKQVGSEDTMSPEDVKVAWAKMYTRAKLSKPDESVQRAFRLAVYAYACKNGTSREGDYSAQIVMSNGHKFGASAIPFATGRLNVRKFFRGNMDESYEALKGSRVMEMDDRYVQKAATLGVDAAAAFAMADWMADCPGFTPNEGSAHKAAFVHGLNRSRRARDGHTLEQVEGKRMNQELEAQGPGYFENETSTF